MASGIQVPLEVAGLLCVCGVVFGGWLSHLRTAPRPGPRHNPLRGLLKQDNLARAVDLAAHRDARRQASQALLHGRINQVSGDLRRWSPVTDEAVRARIAAVMRAGLRRQDHVALTEGGRFTIIVPGADERTAVRIADRLRGALGQMHLPQFGPDVRLTASFGVAADGIGASGEALERRARRALAAAATGGEGQVMPASKVEEVILLPPPAASGAAASAA